MHAWRSIKYGAAVPSFARITCVNEELGAAVGFKLGRDAKFLSNKMLHMDISCPRGGAAPDSVIRLVTQLRDIFSAYRASSSSAWLSPSASVLRGEVTSPPASRPSSSSSSSSSAWLSPVLQIVCRYEDTTVIPLMLHGLATPKSIIHVAPSSTQQLLVDNVRCQIKVKHKHPLLVLILHLSPQILVCQDSMPPAFCSKSEGCLAVGFI